MTIITTHLDSAAGLDSFAEGSERGQGGVGQLGGGHELQGVGAGGGQGLCGGQQHGEAGEGVAQDALHGLGPGLGGAGDGGRQQVVQQGDDLRRHRVGHVAADEGAHWVRSVQEKLIIDHWVCFTPRQLQRSYAGDVDF